MGQQVLGVVGVLVLVDEDVAVSPGQQLSHVRAVAHQKNGAEQQVVEVHRMVAGEQLLVLAIDGDELLAEECLFLARQGLGRSQGVLGVGNGGVEFRGRELIRRHVQLRHRLFHQAKLVRAVVDRKVAFDPRRLGELPQKPRAAA